MLEERSKGTPLADVIDLDAVRRRKLQRRRVRARPRCQRLHANALMLPGLSSFVAHPGTARVATSGTNLRREQRRCHHNPPSRHSSWNIE